MKIKTTMGYYHIPVRMAVIRKTTNTKCWEGCGEKETLLFPNTVDGNIYQYRCYAQKTVKGFLKKLKIEIPYNPAI